MYIPVDVEEVTYFCDSKETVKGFLSMYNVCNKMDNVQYNDYEDGRAKAVINKYLRVIYDIPEAEKHS